MREIKKGNIVSRDSYGNDIIFYVKRIIKSSNKREVAILKGIDVRVEADAPIEDLRIVCKEEQKAREMKLESRILYRINKEVIQKENRIKEVIYTGRILHLDGDTHLSN